MSTESIKQGIEQARKRFQPPSEEEQNALLLQAERRNVVVGAIPPDEENDNSAKKKFLELFVKPITRGGSTMSVPDSSWKLVELGEMFGYNPVILERIIVDSADIVNNMNVGDFLMQKKLIEQNDEIIRLLRQLVNTATSATQPVEKTA